MAEFNETVIEHIGGDDWWGVSTGEEALRNQLMRLAKQHPDDIQLIAKNKDGSAYFHVGFRWIRLKKPRVLTEEDKKYRTEIILKASRASTRKLVETSSDAQNSLNYRENANVEQFIDHVD